MAVIACVFSKNNSRLKSESGCDGTGSSLLIMNIYNVGTKLKIGAAAVYGRNGEVTSMEIHESAAPLPEDEG